MSGLPRSLVFGPVLCLAAALVLSGCKQGEGDRCEIDSDCSSGLTCDNNAGQCVRPMGTTPRPDAGPDARAADGGGADQATTTPDAPPAPPDNRPADIGVDAPAPADAPVDAAPLLDVVPDTTAAERPTDALPPG